MNGSPEQNRKLKKMRPSRRATSPPRGRGFRASLESLEARTLLATYVWTNAAGGDWDIASNWVNSADSSNHQVPSASDDAQINMSDITVTHASSASDAVNSLMSSANLIISSGTLSVASTSVISGSLTLSGGTLTGTGTVTVNGLTTWMGGEMAGSGVTDALGGMAIGDPVGDQEFLDQRTLDNAGAATLAGYSSGYGLYVSSGATIDNETGASFAFITDAVIQDHGGTPDGGTFINAGTLSKTGGTGTSTISSGVTLTSTGAINAGTGTLSLRGGGSLGGTYTVTGTVSLDAGDFTLADGLDVSGAGTMGLTGGTVTVAGAATLPDLVQTGGTLTGAGTLTVTGPITWAGGSESGTGTTVADGGMTVGDQLGNQEFLDQRTLDNAGAATLAGYSSGYGLYLSSGATIDNEAGASFAFITDAVIQDFGGTPDGGTFINAGTLSKTGGTGTSTISSGVTLTSTGAINAGTGTLSLRGGGSLGGTYTVTGTVSLDAGDFTLADGLDVSGAGTMGLTGGTVTVAGAATLPDLVQTGGTLTGAGTLTVTGPITWAGGSESGTGTTVADGGMTVGDQVGDQEFLDQRTLENAGAATLAGYSSSYGLNLSSGATFDNQAGGSFAFVTDAEIGDAGGTPDGGTFVNDGTFSKTGGTGTSIIGGGITFTDTGSLQALSGILSLRGGGALGGTVTVTGAVSLDAGAFVLEDGLDVIGTGTVGLTGGTATVAGAATLPNLTQTGGTITGNGTLTVTGLTTWMSGEMAGSGTTDALGGMAIGDQVGDQELLDQRTLENAGAATLAGYSSSYGLNLSSGATFDNQAGGSFAFVTDAEIGDAGGTPDGGTFVNDGTLSKTGGTGISIIGGGITFTDTGTLQALTGTLSLRGGGTISGASTLTADPGADLDFGGGTFAAVAGSSITGTGTGTVSFSGATVTVAGTYSVAGTTFVGGGEVDFSVASSTGALTQTGGTLAGAGTLTVTGPITWVGGSESGTGTTVAEGGMTLGDQAGDQEFLDQRTLENAGAATLAGYSSSYGLNLSSGATFDNQAGGSFAFVTDAEIGDAGGTPDRGTFVNDGTLSKTGGTGTSIIGGGITFTDTGTLQALSGTLSLRGGGTISGASTLTADPGADLDFGGGTFAAVAGSSITGTGTGTVSFSGATVTVAGTYSVSGTTFVGGGEVDFSVASCTGALTQTGGTLAGAGTLTVTGPITWVGGYESGTGTTVAEGGMTLGDQAGDQEFLDQRTLENAGAATLAGYSSSYGLNLSSGATFDNQAGGSFAFITDASINSNGGSPSGGTFLNEGTLSKTGGTGNSIIGGGITLTDTGTVAVSSGTLQLSGAVTVAGIVEATSGGSLVMTSPPTNLAGGTLTGGIWIVGANCSMSLGAGITTDAASITLDGTGADFSSLSPLAQIALGDRLEVLEGGSFTTAGDLDNAGTIDLAPGTLTVQGNFTEENSGEFDSSFGGPAAGSQFGLLDVSGQATLDGILSASLIDGYAPAQGASYPILTFASVAGDFSALFGLAFEDGSGFTPIFNPGINPTELDLAVVSEPAGTNTTVQSSENPSNYSDVVTLTADVSPVGSTSLVPTGTVTFYDGGTAIDTEKLVNGAASFATSVLMGGQQSIIVQYNGDSNFSSSNSTALHQVVNRVGSTTSLASSLDPSIGGRSVTFKATLSPAAPAHGTPGGTVTFYDGTTAIDTETLAGGTASYTTSLLAGGGHAISVVYAGDSNFTGSQSPVINQVVTPEVIIWTNAGSGDWDTASNWVNAADPTDHHVPTDYDRAQINISGITVTHGANTADSVYSLTVAIGTTLSFSNGSLAIATNSTDSGNLTMSGGTLSLAAGLTISGHTDWTGGTITGGGTFTTQGSLTLGDPNQYDIEELDGATLVNPGAATIATLNGGYYGLFLYDGATFDNQTGASFTFLTSANLFRREWSNIPEQRFVDSGGRSHAIFRHLPHLQSERHRQHRSEGRRRVLRGRRYDHRNHDSRPERLPPVRRRYVQPRQLIDHQRCRYGLFHQGHRQRCRQLRRRREHCRLWRDGQPHRHHHRAWRRPQHLRRDAQSSHWPVLHHPHTHHERRHAHRLPHPHRDRFDRLDRRDHHRRRHTHRWRFPHSRRPQPIRSRTPRRRHPRQPGRRHHRHREQQLLWPVAP